VAGEPGVWFIRQFVSSRLVAAVGRLRYGEPFWPTPIRSRVVDLHGEVRAEYGVGPAAFGWHVNVTGSRAAQVPPPESSEHHFIERCFACRTRPDGNLGVFRVTHPAWAVRDVRAVDYRIDFGSLYGRSGVPESRPTGRRGIRRGVGGGGPRPIDATGITGAAAPP